MLLKKTVTDLDETDIEIMRIMQDDARITMRELARQVSMSPPSTAERVRRLEEGGFIQGYRTALDPAKLGYTTHAFILISKLRPDQVRPFYAQVQNIPEIVSVQKLYSGGYFAMVEVFCHSPKQLDAVQSHLVDLGYADQTTLLGAPNKEKLTGLDLELELGEE
ncbi:MAG: Lrp/AsnC family transcriptional regulator [Firmicutes bacterium]|nr:Lrp/AsnC family transcriptional regulator [Bacillota bacterium]